MSGATLSPTSLSKNIVFGGFLFGHIDLFPAVASNIMLNHTAIRMNLTSVVVMKWGRK